MARAKRTQRAEARRRYRNYLQQIQGEGEEPIEEEESAPRTSARAIRQDGSPVIRPGQKVGMVQALKLATRQVHYLDDIKYAPTLIRHTNAIWPAALISIGALAWGLTRTDYNDGSIAILIGFALYPPMIQPMLAGFLAPRATWLAGLISSVISGACFLVLVIWYFGPTKHLSNIPDTAPAIGGSDYIILGTQVLAAAIALGSLLGAASGWYKRFLGLLGAGSPRNQQRPSQRPSPKRSPARR